MENKAVITEIITYEKGIEFFGICEGYGEFVICLDYEEVEDLNKLVRCKGFKRFSRRQFKYIKSALDTYIKKNKMRWMLNTPTL